MAEVRFFALLSMVGAVAITASACGSSGPSDASSTDVVAVPACQVDSDCPAGQVCRSIRLGESEERNCVPDSLHDEAGTVVRGADPDAGDDDVGDDGGEPAPPPPDGGPPPTDAGNDVTVPPTDAGNGACTSSLTVAITAKGPLATCQYDTTVVASSPATLEYPCAGGAASVVFGAQTFSGALTNGALSVQNVDTYPLPIKSTGTICYYTATQTISGTLASGALKYAYTEVLTATSPAACKLLSIGCTESGPVTVGP
jgi:Cys-rich repeat protein